MKVKLLLVFIIGAFLVFNTTYVEAEIDTSSMDNSGIANVDCGEIGLKCCDLRIDKDIIPDISQVEDLGLPASGLFMGLLRPAISRLTSPAITNVEETIDMLPKTPCHKGLPSFGENKVTYKDISEYTSEDYAACICIADENEKMVRLCSNITKLNERTACLNCVDKGEGVWTGLGCLYSDIPKLIKEKIMVFGLGLAGMTALLCIIYSAIMLQMSQGNPEKIKKSQQLLTSCITGLVLIIFSILILKLIGVEILKIPLDL